MDFLNITHMESFKELVKKAKARPGEKELKAALFLLSSPLLAGKDTGRYVEEGTIRFSELVSKMGPWSSGERALVKLAAALFNSYWKADVNEVFRSLDADNTRLALEALKIRFRGRNYPGISASSMLPK